MTPQRLDKWLFFARIFKSRSLAQTAITEGRVWVDGRESLKSAAQVKPGDRIVVVQGSRHRWLTVLAAGERRGPAPEAQTLYEEELNPANPPDGG